MTTTKLVRRYDVRYKYEWAVVFLTTDGVFSVVSTFGNYGHFWNSTGCDDVREFFFRMSESKEYFIKKLCPKEVFDEDATVEALKESFEDDPRVLEALKNPPGVSDEHVFIEWLNEEGLNDVSDMYECFHTQPDPQAVALVDMLIQIWLPMLRQEIEAERQSR